MSRALRLIVAIVLLGGVAGGIAGAALVAYLVPRLPSIENLKDVRLQVPLRVYTRDGKLLAEFGEKRRVPVQLQDVPGRMIKAVLAAEDERFYQHPGVDWQGLARAVIYLIRTGEKGPGGSTITMQVARNFFLGREKTYIRKLNEILLALKIERELSKDEILELYFNKIFLGQRAYGVGAAAQVYYGRKLSELTLPQVAMIAGLPKAPSRFNPVADPERAIARRNYVLGRMRELGFIDPQAYAEAVQAPVTASVHGLPIEAQAPYVAEMVRAWMEAREGDDAYTAGYRVYTTIDSELQAAAVRAVRQGLLEYDRRHGWRGPEARIDPSGGAEALDARLAPFRAVGGLPPAVVTSVQEQQATAYSPGLGEVRIPWEGLSWARSYIDENRRGAAPGSAAEVLEPGDVVRLAPLGEDAAEGGGKRDAQASKPPQGEAPPAPPQRALAQIPAIEGALVALDPLDGSMLALVGGFDFERSKFNRATQAERQPGSSFKPFIYSSALERGFTPASFINDAPVVFDDPSLEAAWRPENYSGKFFGPTRLREALYKSRNLVSIRLLRAVGVEFAVDYVQRFGFDPERLPRNLSLALGSATVTPVELARGYAVLANGGYRVTPYYVDRVLGPEGGVLLASRPARVCRDCGQDSGLDGVMTVSTGAAPRPARSPLIRAALGLGGGEPAGAPGRAPFRAAPRVISPQNAWLMNSMMRDVIRRGTGRRALQLGRGDLAGKTGTTNDQRDAWFSGFTPSLVTTAWVGFDKLRPLGRRETGARAALPVWMHFMGAALQGVPEQTLEQPEGLVTVRIDPETGALAEAGDPDAIFETFRAELAPGRLVEADRPSAAVAGPAPSSSRGVTEQLF